MVVVCSRVNRPGSVTKKLHQLPAAAPVTVRYVAGATPATAAVKPAAVAAAVIAVWRPRMISSFVAVPSDV